MPAVNILIAGQSFAQALFNAPEAKAAFLAEFTRADYTVNFTYFAAGGTSALKEHCRSDYPTGYWWDYDLDQPGPMLTGAIASINASTNKPTKIIWAQGEQDSTASTVSSSRFQCASHSIVSALRIACQPTAPLGVGVFLHRIGRRILSGAPWPGVQIVREAQIAMDSADPSVFGFDTYDLTLLGDDPRYSGDNMNSHMETLGNSELGFRAAQRILLSLSKPARVAPCIFLVERIAPDKIRLTFSYSTALVKPATPAHIVIRSGSAIDSNLSFSWIGNQLEVTASCPFAPGSVLLTPYGEMNEIDRPNLIRDLYRQPLQSTALTIPD